MARESALPKVAFYAPLKPPGHATPSGDRRFARLLMRALRRAGFEVHLASSLRSRNSDGDAARQKRIEGRAARLLPNLLARYGRNPPDIWFTYHLYHKAPDLLGPAVCQALNIPYVVAEASVAPTQSTGPWARGYRLSTDALAQAALVLQPNPKDFAGVAPFLHPGVDQIGLSPFLDAKQEGAEAVHRHDHRAAWAARLSLPPELPWMIATGMMRNDGKKLSFLLLAQAMARLKNQNVRLILVGDGPARAEIEAAYAGDNRVCFAGKLESRALRGFNAACDLFVWPALGEAFGMAPLEAQAAGLPVVLGDRPGIRTMVRDGETGLLTPEGDVVAFAVALETVLQDPVRRQEMADAARLHVQENHDLSSAAQLLRTRLIPLIKDRS
ncbi:MAG: glycosyltransferase family 4 protein [Alphaproteobacteria bacterium]|nr:glycosyltransferase family 4 protein [Alphaproteobacteria bacterium]